MARDGIYWFTDLNRIAQKVSVVGTQIEDLVPEIVTTVTTKGAQRMREIVLDGGMNATQEGGPRVLSGAMISSVGSNLTGAGGGKASGEFGFIKNPPKWTGYQENGTGRVSPMLAYFTAAAEARNNLDIELGKAGQKIKTYWNNI